ncbi:type II toxin-antitoxin system VapB family antitoxin [Geodermatophilus sabuli]|uniref:type II toxin-antitoxin system VapB family antitoxin n=1 Tax=Geodermatophilus sabuli TaxID=1564158 RepID=UPI003F81D6A4
MARRTCRRRSSCATVTPPRTGRRVVRDPPGDVPALAGAWHSPARSARPAYVGEPPPSRGSHGPGDGGRRGGRPRVETAADRLGGHRSGARGARRAEVVALIFKAIGDGRPYPEHGLSTRDWAMIPPRQIRMDTLVTTKRELALDALLAEDSTFYGDLFPHAVQWHGELYLEDGLHRALRAALQQRNVIHVRVLDLDALMPAEPAGQG